MNAIPTDWLWGLLGGFMIGGAAAFYLLVNGRIMGASGILGGLLDGSGSDTAMERSAFIAGVIGVPAIVAAAGYAPATQITQDLGIVVVGGLLVGIGTRMANGCTSGHGVCGMSRFSVRGIVATGVYLVFGFISMAVLRHGLGVI